MIRYDSFRPGSAELPTMRRWLFVALVVSLALHGAFFVFAHWKRLENFAAPVEQLAPPMRLMKRVTLPQVPEQQETERIKLQEKPAPVKNIALPKDKPVVEEMRIAPQPVDLEKQVLADKPTAVAAGWDQLAKAAEAASRGDLERDLGSAAALALKTAPPVSRNQRVLTLPPGRLDGDGVGGSAGIPGLKSLDEALAATGPISTGSANIGIQGGALFEYNSHDLRPAAVEQLRKLGALIERNPTATFVIEGHTDSLGGPEYNQQLSQRRAESVKIWLVEILGLAPERIQTRGLGNTKPIVSADKSKEEQAPNRRVEIVVKTARRS